MTKYGSAATEGGTGVICLYFRFWNAGKMILTRNFRHSTFGKS